MMFAELPILNTSATGTPGEEELHRTTDRAGHSQNGDALPFSEELFTKLLCLERRRAERSRKPFALMLIDATKLLQTAHANGNLRRLAAALAASTRETDVRGWYKAGSVIGIILTELGAVDTSALRKTMLTKVTSALQANLGPNQAEGIHISFHVFPEDQNPPNGGSARTGLQLYPDLHRANETKRASRLIKRVIDITGSLTPLMVLSPVFLAIAIAIKLTSKGPVLFKQERIGQYGAPFTFLKFRSMYFQNDPKVHQEYLRRFISGKVECKQPNGNGAVYKLQDDPRITPLGRFLRKTSLDELPQFFNVLRGDMSLVGPRPPIPYEAEVYDIWHRRRFLEVKPGITGLWQVKGRSKVTFDDMVRLDIQYMKEWSLGLDFKILLETPRAVFFGTGAR